MGALKGIVQVERSVLDEPVRAPVIAVAVFVEIATDALAKPLSMGRMAGSCSPELAV
jgi:hypothetical protein